MKAANRNTLREPGASPADAPRGARVGDDASVAPPVFRPYAAIRASAGTGKTFTLTGRYIRLLLDGVPAERILATTFTRKAAGEILDRVVLRLAEAARSDKGAATLAREVDLPGTTRAGCRETLVNLLRSLHRVSILTIDSFFMRLAAGFEFEIGLPPGWQIEERSQYAGIRNAALEDLITSLERHDLLGLLRSVSRGQARAAVLPLLQEQIEAAYDIYLNCRHPRPWHTLGPEDAWDEAVDENRISSSHFAFEDRRLWERSQPADPAWVERLQACELPRTKAGHPNTRWLSAIEKLVNLAVSGDESKFFAATLVQSAFQSDGSYYGQPLPDDLVAVLREHADPIRDRLLAEFQNHSRAMYRLVRLYEAAIEQRRIELGVYGFTDVARALARARVTEAGDILYYRIDGRIDHVLLDEFQDTSLTQFFLLEPIIAEVVAGRGRDVQETTTAPPDREPVRTFFCVGDVKQSLYEWRNAEPELLPAISDYWKQVEPDDLKINWRSSPVVLDAVDRVFGGLEENPALNDDHAAAQRWSQRYSTNVARHADMPGCVIVRTARKFESLPPDELDPDDTDEGRTSGDGGGAAADSADDETGGEPERKWTATEKLHCCIETAADRVAELREKAGLRPVRVGILFRRKKYIACMINALRERKISASEEGGSTVADSPAVAAVLSLIRVSDQPADSASWFHVCHTPIGAVVDASPEVAAEPRARRRAASKVRLLLADDGYAASINAWVRVMAHACSDRDLRRLGQLLDLAERFDTSTDADTVLRPASFVAFVEANPVEDPSSETVRVMTIHASKGLEFDHVILPELDQGFASRRPQLVAHRDEPLAPISVVCRYPGSDVLSLDPRLARYRDRWRQQQVEQALSALYVAMTRARRALECIIAPFSATKQKSGRLKYSLSAAGVLRGALCPHLAEADWNEVIWSSGSNDWWKAIDPRAPDEPEGASAPPISQPAASTDHTPLVMETAVAMVRALDESHRAGDQMQHTTSAALQIRLAPQREGDVLALSVKSPSALSETDDISPRDIFTRHRGRRGTARQRGTLVHAWFECLTWLPPEDVAPRATCEQSQVPPTAELIDIARRVAGDLGYAFDDGSGEAAGEGRGDLRAVLTDQPRGRGAGDATDAASAARRGLNVLLNPDEAFDDAVLMFRRALSREHFGPLFTVEHYVDAARAEGLDIATWEVSREHAFAVMDRPPTPRQSDAHPGAQTTSSQTCVLQGVIDRLVIGRDADGVVRFAEVLDFKTDSGRDEGQAAIEDKIRRRYTEQMRAYCRAVSRLYHIPVDSIRVKLLVIEHGLIVPVPHQHS